MRDVQNRTVIHERHVNVLQFRKGNFLPTSRTGSIEISEIEERLSESKDSS